MLHNILKWDILINNLGTLIEGWVKKKKKISETLIIVGGFQIKKGIGNIKISPPPAFSHLPKKQSEGFFKYTPI